MRLEITEKFYRTPPTTSNSVVFIDILFYMDTHTLEMVGVIIVAVITAIVGPTILEIVKVKLKNKNNPDPIRKEIEHGTVVNGEIEDIREELKADRCWITMYHNGGNFLTMDKSMKKFSMMYETCRPTITPVAHIFTNLPVSLYTRATEEILLNKHIYIPDYTDPKVATYGLRGAAESSNAKSSYSIGLFDIKTGNCIGILGIDYISRKKSLTENQLIFLNERSQRVAGYLSNYLHN